MRRMELDAWGATDVGRVRERNEDAVRIDAARGFFMVADGVGGGAGGEVASAMAVDVVQRHLAEEIDQVRAAGLAGDAACDQLGRRLQRAVVQASAAIYQRGQQDPALLGMATTAVIMQVVGDRAVVAHVGDSRLYMIRERSCYQVTQDHSWVQMMVARGQLSPAEAADHPHANAIVRAVGQQPAVDVDIIYLDLRPDDAFVLCTDGLSDEVGVDDILALSAGAPRAAAEGLIARANANGGNDNISTAVVRVGGALAAAPPVRTELKVELLQHVFLFRDLTFQESLKVLAAVHEQRVTAGETVVREGDPGETLYIVVDGDLEVSQGGVILNSVGRGNHFGELGLATDGVRSATVVARRPAVLLTLSRDGLFELVRGDHNLAVKLLWGFLRNVADRVKVLSTELTGARTAR
jgi:serine/threonine protein phosphatase PrpC